MRRRFFAARALFRRRFFAARALFRNQGEALPGSFVRPRRLRYGATAVDRSSGSRERLEEPFARVPTGKDSFLACLDASVLPSASYLSCENGPHSAHRCEG